MKNYLIHRYCFMVIALLLCATPTLAENNDPLEPVNRAIFTFNEYTDRYAFKPLAQTYDYVLPTPVKRGVGNALNNLAMPVVFVNSVLQGNTENAFSSFWSFLLNSTLGIGGIFDFTGSNTSLNVRPEDLGQTLGAWGVGSGPYIVMPIIGPSNVRDTVGFVGDIFMDPFNYVDNDKVVIGRAVIAAVDARYRAIPIVDNVYETSLDPYATFRSAYSQRRRALIANTHRND